MRHMIGLIRPAEGRILFNGEDLWRGSDEDRQRLARASASRIKVVRSGAALTLAENVGLPLAEYTGLSAAEN
jgi:phospholipid/cholesterol/gamma-HCH transport system ATP-binding protein